MKCSICGTDNHDKVDFCRHCGVSIARTAASPAPPVAATATCTQCHRRYATPARFCDQCGTRLPVRFESPSTRVDAPINNAETPTRNAASPASKPLDSPETAKSRPAPPGSSLAVSAPRSMVETTAPRRTLGARLKRAGTRLWQRAAQWFAPDAGNGTRTSRQLRLIAGLSVALIGIVLSGFLLARTLIAGAPPWQGPTQLAEADLALIAAAETAPETPATLPGNGASRGSEGVKATGSPSASRTVAVMQPEQTNDALAPVANASDAAMQEEQANDSANPVGSIIVADQSTDDIPPLEAAPLNIAGTNAKTAETLPEPEYPLIAAPLLAASQVTKMPDVAGPDKPTRVVRPLRPGKESARQRSERRPAQVARSSSGWYAAMKTQLHQCASDPNLLTRVFCAEKTKFRYCSPNRWGQVAECVKTQYRDTSGIPYLGRRVDVEDGPNGQG